jgi:peptidoglycan/LPS O-acetylase OafA/YrhL
MEKMPGHSDFLATPLFAAIIITVALGQGWLSRVLDTAPLVSLGRVSYSIYLVHPVVIWLFETFLQYGLKLRRAGFYPVALGAGDALTAAYLIAVVLVSGWTFTHIEDRFRRRTRAWVEG